VIRPHGHLSPAHVTRIRVLTVAGIVTLLALLVRLALFDPGSGSGLFHPHGWRAHLMEVWTLWTPVFWLSPAR
jgi:hypothetical protein